MKVRLENISKSFEKGKSILKDISLMIDDGEFCVFLGPSGCGKTTLLRIIAGLEKEDAGTIFFNDKVINSLEPKNRNIGMVFQNYALYPHLNVFDNIAFPLKISGEKKEKIKERVLQIAEFIGLKEYLDYKPKQLSGGQRQRVALGRAISRSPQIFLFDEPLSNLDAKLRMQMRTELYQLHKEIGTTSIYVTHDQVEAMTMGDKIVVLNNGIIQQIGPPFEIYENPSNLFVATFVGNPQINLFTIDELNLNDNSISLLENISLNQKFVFNFNESFKKILQSNPVKIAIRPENIFVKPIFPHSIFLGKRKILTIEYMGNETIVNFEFNKELKSFRTNEKLQLNQDEYIDIYLNQDKLIFFDNNNNKI